MIDRSKNKIEDIFSQKEKEKYFVELPNALLALSKVKPKALTPFLKGNNVEFILNTEVL